MKQKRKTLADILADYSDALITGKAVDRQQLLENYDGDRQELAELLVFIDTLDQVRPRPRKEFVERMRNLIKQHRMR